MRKWFALFLLAPVLAVAAASVSGFNPRTMQWDIYQAGVYVLSGTPSILIGDNGMTLGTASNPLVTSASSSVQTGSAMPTVHQTIEF